MTWNFFSITSLYFTVTHINKHKKRRSRLFHFQCLRSAPQQNLVQQPPTHQGCGLREPRRRQAPAVMSAREVRAIPVGPEFITSITFGMEADGLHGGDRSTGTVIRLLGPLRDRWGTQSFTLESKHEDPLFFPDIFPCIEPLRSFDGQSRSMEESCFPTSPNHCSNGFWDCRAKLVPIVPDPVPTQSLLLR